MTSTAVSPTAPIGIVPGSRSDVLDAILDAVAWRVPQAGGRAALQGPRTAVDTWLAASGSVDLDVWADPIGYRVLCALMARMNGARVQHAADPARLQHTSWLVETTTGPAVIDVTVGDLRVGPVTLIRESDVSAQPSVVADRSVPRLAGAAAALDLLVRPLLRGKVPPADRLAEARAAWEATTSGMRTTVTRDLGAQLSSPVADAIVGVLDGGDVPSDLLPRARRAYLRASVRGLGAAWRQRRVIVPAGKRSGIAGVRARGVLVVLVGTDGSGKSTLAASVAERLDRLGVPSTPAYMGMAHGNLPGVDLARKVLGIPSPAEQAERASKERAVHPDTDVTARTSSPTDHVLLRRAAAWFYAGEYLVRYLRDIRPYRRIDGAPAVVIADRYVYDLQDSPWPGSRAAAVARRLMPRPDVLLVPDAPDSLIHARKPERAAHEQAAQQAGFRALAIQQPARSASLLVDTSGSVAHPADPVAPVIAAIIEAMHVEP